MKTLLLTVTITLLATACILGQPAQSKSGGVGIKAGVGFGTIYGDGVDWFENTYAHVPAGRRTGITVGGFATVRLTRALTLQPELLYINKGAKWEQGTGSLTGKLAYLEVPLLLKLSIPMRGSMTPNLFSGPYLGLRTTSRLSLEGAAGYGSGDLEVNSQTESVDYGIVFGVGTSLRTGHRGAILLEVRYELGLLDVNKFDQTSYAGYGVPIGFQGDVKTNSLGLLLGYSFR